MKKMVLLEPRIYERLTQKVETTTQREASRLDLQMKEILDSDRADSEKLKLYQDLLFKFKMNESKLRAPPTEFVFREQEKPLAEAQILKNVRSKQAGKTILKRIKEHNSTGWNHKGELLFDEEPVAKSSIAKLVDAAVKRKKTNLAGWAQFEAALPKWESSG